MDLRINSTLEGKEPLKFTWEPLRLKNNVVELMIYFENPLIVTSNLEITTLEIHFLGNIRIGNNYLNDSQQTLYGEVPAQLMNDTLSIKTSMVVQTSRDLIVGQAVA